MIRETRPSRRLGFTLLLLCLFAARAQAVHAASGAVVGSVESVSGPAGAQSIQGWACETGNAKPATVHVFTGGAPGAGQLYNTYTASLSPGAAAASACGTSTGHSFAIPVTGDLFSRAGAKIFVYALAPDGSSGALLTGSGSFAVPASTTVGSLGSLEANGSASGWVFDQAASGAPIQVAVYADGDALMGAESGTPVWQGLANQATPAPGNAFGATGNHGFRVQLPAWVTQGIHRLSFYAVNAQGTIAAPLLQSPAVPGSGKVASHFTFSSSASDFPTHWIGYKLPPAPVDFVGLSGTVTVHNYANIFSEFLFYVTFMPSGACPEEGTVPTNGPPGLVQSLWSDIIKTPATGTFTMPVNFTLPVGVPMTNCLVVAINGGTVAGEHVVAGEANLVATYIPYTNPTTQMLGLDNEMCFGQNFGCELETLDDSLSFAAVTPVTQRAMLNTIWGNINDSPFDGSTDFGPLPTGPWMATNDIYLYHGSECAQFGAGRSLHGPGDFYANIPSDATHLLSAPLTGPGGPVDGQTISPLLAGTTSGFPVYQDFQGVTLNAGDCLVELFGMQNTTGAFDNEDQLRAYVTPF